MKSFARRTDWQLQPNELARRLSARRAAGLPLLDLTESNPTRCRLAYPEAQIRAALNSPALLRYSPDPRGLAAARQSIAASYYGAKGEEVKPEQLLLTASTSEAYAYLFRLLAEPGDELLVPRPGYPLFDFLAQICDLKPVSYALAATRGWRIERSSLLAGLGERTRAILAVSPNNPTGSFLASADRDFLLALCAERGLALIVDEVFADYSLDERIEPPCWPAEPPTLLFRLNGLSKTLGLPQLKLSWIYASGPPELLQAALGRLEIIADTFLSVNTPVQLALPRLLELRLPIQGSIRERLRSNLAKLKELAGRSGPAPWRLLPVQGGWYAVLRLPPGRDEEELVLGLLDDEGVYIYPGYFFDFSQEPLLVLSLLTPPDRFAAGLGRLTGYLRRAGL